MLKVEAGGGETAAPGSQAAPDCGGWRMREDKLKTKVFDITQPLILLFNEVEDLQELTEAANNEYSNA